MKYKLTLKEAVELSIKKWTFLSEYKYTSDTYSDLLESDMFAKYPELIELKDYCCLCEKYKLIGMGFHRCKLCELATLDASCFHGVSAYAKWDNDNNQENATAVLNLIKKIL